LIDGWVYGSEETNDKDGRPISTPMRYSIATNTYELLPDHGGKEKYAANGWILGLVADPGQAGQRQPAMIAGTKTVLLPKYHPQPGETYLPSALSSDGRVAAGTVLSSPNLGAEQPLRWICH
jgi:hypothetical protein